MTFISESKSLMWAKRYGFIPQPVADLVSWIETEIRSGKIVGEWNNGLRIHLDAKRHADRMFPWAAAGQPLSSIVEIKDVSSLWEVLDRFGLGELDALVCGDWHIIFPEEARPLLRELESVSEKKHSIDNSSFNVSSVQNAFLANLWGKLLTHQGNMAKAGEAFRKAIELLSDFSEPYSNFGTLLWNLGNRREAFVLFTEAMLKNPHRLAGQLNFFDAGYEMEEYEAMSHILLELMPSYPENAEWGLHLAICYQRVGRLEDSIDVLRDILAKRPEDIEARTLLDRLQRQETKPNVGSMM